LSGGIRTDNRNEQPAEDACREIDPASHVIANYSEGVPMLPFTKGLVISFLTAAFGGISFAASTGPHWEVVNAQVAAGKPVRLDVRLVGADGKPSTGKITITQTRLDMGPDNMAGMTTVAQPVPSTQSGVTSFQAQLVPGRWALNISANVSGVSQPVTGQVVFTAVPAK
jgi:hypothetical protein